EVADASLDAFREAALVEELLRRVLVRVRDLDARRALGAGSEQVELDRADAAADVEHARSRHVAGEVGQRAGGSGQSTLAVAARVRGGAATIEEPPVLRLRAAARHDAERTPTTVALR